MPDVGISAYQFSVKVSHKDEFLNLSNKFGERDFLDILNEGLCRYLEQLQKKAARRVRCTRKYIKHRKRTYSKEGFRARRNDSN